MPFDILFLHLLAGTQFVIPEEEITEYPAIQQRSCWVEHDLVFCLYYITYLNSYQWDFQFDSHKREMNQFTTLNVSQLGNQPFSE